MVTSYERCLASAEIRRQTHYEREAATTRRVMAAHGKSAHLIEQRCQPDWWKQADMWDEDIPDGFGDPVFYTHVEQNAIRNILRSVRRETTLKAIIGRYRIRATIRWAQYDMTPVLRWTIWQWRKKLEPCAAESTLIDDVTRFLAAERALRVLHDQYDPDGSHIAEMEAAKREEREWERRLRARRAVAAAGAGSLPTCQQMTLPLPPTPETSAATGGTRVPVREVIIAQSGD